MTLTASDTQRLTHARFELKAGSRLRNWKILAVLTLGVAAAGFAGLRLATPTLAGQAERVRLQSENAALGSRMATAEQELALERAAHAELERQVTELQSEVNDLNQQLEFLSARSAAR